MRRHTLGIVGSVLVLIGLLGAAAVALVGSVPSVTSPDTGGYASPGARIYFTGAGRTGRIPRTGGIGMMGSGGCVTCHGPGGRGGRVGGMMGGGIEAPDIRYSTLTSPHTDEGKREPGWTDAQIATVIRTGEEPDGTPLSVYMPRWQMDDQDMSDLISYLKELK